MIGKPEWFKRRKYSGWGLTPKTWQGWVYIAIFIIPFVIIISLPTITTEFRITFTTIWLLVLLIDVLDIMRKLKQDEREKIHEAIAERNALWGIIFILTIGVLYEVITAALQEKFYVNPFLAAALIIGLIIKSATNIYLDKKN